MREFPGGKQAMAVVVCRSGRRALLFAEAVGSVEGPGDVGYVDGHVAC